LNDDESPGKNPLNNAGARPLEWILAPILNFAESVNG
jgi:hypothetical protein